MSNYLVTVRSEDLKRVVLNSGDIVSLSLLNPSSLGTQVIYIDGLVSDGRLTELSGEITFKIGTSSATLDFPMNLTPIDGETITLDAAQMNLEVIRNLSGELVQFVAFTGSVAVTRILNGSSEELSIADAPSTLSASVYTYVSDWSELTVSALMDKTIDEMVYKEVGG